MRIAPLVFLCATLLVAACGDDETSEPAPGPDASEDTATADSTTGSDVASSDAVTIPEDTSGEVADDDVNPSDTGVDVVSDGAAADASMGDATPDVAIEDSASDSATAADASVDGSGQDAQMTDDVASDAEDLPEWACTTELACEDPGAMCIGPEEQLCGICFEVDNPCVNDGQCDMGMVCAEEPHPCACTGERDCIAPCIAGDPCGSGKQCDAGGHCVAQPCSQDADCPSNFSCTGGACERVTCKASSECDDYCVKGSCFAIPGNCGYPPP